MRLERIYVGQLQRPNNLTTTSMHPQVYHSVNKAKSFSEECSCSLTLKVVNDCFHVTVSVRFITRAALMD